jgi:hypothetical protein
MTNKTAYEIIYNVWATSAAYHTTIEVNNVIQYLELNVV